MLQVKLLCATLLICLSGLISVLAQERWPEKMRQDMECLKRHGLIQGTVTEVRRGEAHFAPYDREIAIGGSVPAIRYNGAFIEGRTKISPDVIKVCVPSADLRKVN